MQILTLVEVEGTGNFFAGEVGTEVLDLGLHALKQALYHLSHTSIPFCSDYFEDGVSRTICLT
jgi:hypothetical protein